MSDKCTGTKGRNAMMTVFPDWGLSEARTFARSGHRHCEWLARFLAGGAFHSACGCRQFEEAGVNASEDQRAALSSTNVHPTCDVK
jgi:hypothetical protein